MSYFTHKFVISSTKKSRRCFRFSGRLIGKPAICVPLLWCEGRGAVYMGAHWTGARCVLEGSCYIWPKYNLTWLIYVYIRVFIDKYIYVYLILLIKLHSVIMRCNPIYSSHISYKFKAENKAKLSCFRCKPSPTTSSGLSALFLPGCLGLRVGG